MNISLDKYLTTEPDNGFTEYCELVCDRLGAPICEWDDAANNDPCCSDEFTALLEAMFNAGIDQDTAAIIVNKSFDFFEKWLRVNDNVPGFDPKDYSSLLGISK